MSIEFAWNTQKNQMSDIKGKEREQEREGQIKNDMIDLDRTHLNYDLVVSELNLYQRAKERVDQLKSENKRVQKNSVITYSNIITIPESAAKKMSNEQMQDYFKTCHDYFADRFGKENVLSAKVHLDETTPHMHLHFMPIDKETGRLQARTTMNKAALNQIHDEIPERLREKGFDVVRGSGEKTKQKLDIHEYKAKLNWEKEKAELKEIKSILYKELNELEHDKTILDREVYYMRTEKSREFKKIEKGFEEKVEAAKTEAIQRIGMIKEEVTKFEYDMSQNQERLIMDTQDMNGLLDATKKDLEEHQKQLNERIDSLKELDFDESVNLDLKPNLLNKVSMSNDTFLELKKRAEVAERMQRALRISDQRVQALEKDNRKKDSQLGEMFTLRMENSSLKRQVEFFKQVIDKMRELFLKQKDKEGQPKVSEKLVSQIIGFSKHYVGQGLKMNKEAEPQNEHEKTGRDVAIKALAAERKEKGYGSEMER
ncbi:MobV family relaxase [Exiguobacterium artemiae]|uniref:MobV family relaxase n=4 Tax=Exiguobacterium TaxID=33986 RepID=UPI003D080C4A